MVTASRLPILRMGDHMVVTCHLVGCVGQDGVGGNIHSEITLSAYQLALCISALTVQF